jgi:hypothetical protein
MPDATATAIAATGAAGTVTLTAYLIGVDPQPLVWAVFGAAIATTVPALPIGRLRAVVRFLTAVPAGALLGCWAAAEFRPNSHWAPLGASLIAAAALYAGLHILLSQLEPLARGWADKLGARRDPNQP